MRSLTRFDHSSEHGTHHGEDGIRTEQYTAPLTGNRDADPRHVRHKFTCAIGTALTLDGPNICRRHDAGVHPRDGNRDHDRKERKDGIIEQRDLLEVLGKQSDHANLNQAQGEAR